MGTSERLHRTDAQRTEPIRHAATYLRDPGPEGAAAAPPDGEDNSVAHGVRLGYKVIEEQILQGQRLAQRLGKATAGFGAGTGSGEVNVLIERVLSLYKDVGKLCVDAVESVARNPALRSGFARAASSVATPAPGGRGPAAEPAAGTRFAIEVASRRRAQVRLDLGLSPGSFVPRVHALHAADPSMPALTTVSFDLDPALPEPMLRIEVPDAQPAATYTGVVVDSASNEPRGTVSVRLLP
ncbi:MAG TPA: hypothetical protein VGI11_08095 [Variovorax sp.]